MPKHGLVIAADRAGVLARTRTLKMARSQHAYVRGSTVKFYEWPAESDGKVPTGPSIWICGDCHLGNLGLLADADGKVEIQIHDLDQAVIGNPAHDNIRLALSLAAAARGFVLPVATTARMIEAIIAGYIEGLANRAGANDDDQPAPVRKLLRAAGCYRWKHLAEERIEDVRPVIPLGSRYWPMTGEENRLLSEMLASETIAGQWRSVVDDSDDLALELLDAAYWMKGCSSHGRLRYAAIVRLKADGPPALLDIKVSRTQATMIASYVTALLVVSIDRASSGATTGLRPLPARGQLRMHEHDALR